jgi:hypothetical protein
VRLAGYVARPRRPVQPAPGLPRRGWRCGTRRVGGGRGSSAAAHPLERSPRPGLRGGRGPERCALREAGD